MWGALGAQNGVQTFCARVCAPGVVRFVRRGFRNPPVYTEPAQSPYRALTEPVQSPYRARPQKPVSRAHGPGPPTRFIIDLDNLLLGRRRCTGYWFLWAGSVRALYGLCTGSVWALYGLCLPPASGAYLGVHATFLDVDTQTHTRAQTPSHTYTHPSGDCSVV